MCGKEVTHVFTDGRLTVQLPPSAPNHSLHFSHATGQRHTHTLLSSLQFIRWSPFQHFFSNEKEKRMFSEDKRLKITAEGPIMHWCVAQGQRQHEHTVFSSGHSDAHSNALTRQPGHSRDISQVEIFLHSLYSAAFTYHTHTL